MQANLIADVDYLYYVSLVALFPGAENPFVREKLLPL
jgi:hypothetical protein